MIPDYPQSSELSREMRPVLHPPFQKLPDGISEFTFANLYLFRATHQYRISRLPGGLYLITGSDAGRPFFMLPFGLPDRDVLLRLFDTYGSMKAVSLALSAQLSLMGFVVLEDRDNFDYLYSRQALAELTGRDMHRRRNQVNAFTREFKCDGRPLLDEYTRDAVSVLETWRSQRGDAGDYEACREALERMYELQLCGGIYYIDDRPVGFSLGEELSLGTSFVVHFEKAIDTEKYRGIYQYISQKFSSILPEKYDTINREQDLGEPGLRRAKESYNPVGFVKKYRAIKSLG